MIDTPVDTEEAKLPELSEDYKLTCLPNNPSVSVFKRSIMGEVDNPCLCAAIDDNDQYVAGCYSNGEIKIYDPHGGGLLKRILDSSAATGHPVAPVIKWKPTLEGSELEHFLLAGDDSGTLTKYDVTDGMVVEKISWEGDEENKIYALDYTQNGRQFAAAGSDKMVRIYDDITMKLIQESDPYKSGHSGSSNQIFSVKFNPDDPNMLISGGWDNNIIIHDLREKGPVNAIIGAYICGESLDIRNNRILSGSNRLDDQLQLWDLGTLKLIETIDWNGTGALKGRDQCKVFCSKFMLHADSGKEYIIAGGSVTNECRIFNPDHEPIINIGEMSRGCFTCDVSASGDSFLCAGGDGVIRLFRIVYGTD